MGRRSSRGSTEAVYAPLLGRDVACSVLHIGRLRGKKLEPAIDAGGDPIELPADAGMPELRRRVAEPGRYRVEARDPGTRARLAYSDHDVQPLDDEPEPERRVTEPMAERTSRSRPMREVSEHAYVGHLHDTINNLRDQLRDASTRSDRELRYERDRADAALKAMQEIDSVRQLAAELKIKADEAGFSPLDAFAHLDQALDLMGNTIDRFKDD